MYQVKNSSSIEGVDINGETLTVQFKSGKSYQYEDVPVETSMGLINAESVGKFFAAEIRSKFTGKLLEEQKEGEQE